MSDQEEETEWWNQETQTPEEERPPPPETAKTEWSLTSTQSDSSFLQPSPSEPSTSKPTKPSQPVATQIWTPTTKLAPPAIPPTQIDIYDLQTQQVVSDSEEEKEEETKPVTPPPTSMKRAHEDDDDDKTPDRLTPVAKRSKTDDEIPESPPNDDALFSAATQHPLDESSEVQPTAASTQPFLSQASLTSQAGQQHSEPGPSGLQSTQPGVSAAHQIEPELPKDPTKRDDSGIEQPTSISAPAKTPPSDVLDVTPHLTAGKSDFMTPDTLSPQSQTNPSRSRNRSGSKIQTLRLPDGRQVKYTHTHTVTMYYMGDKIVHETNRDDSGSSQSQSLSGTSGYSADVSSGLSGTNSSGSVPLTQNSQDPQLKAHRSAEDHLFVSPHIPTQISQRKSKSMPPQHMMKRGQDLPKLPTKKPPVKPRPAAADVAVIERVKHSRTVSSEINISDISTLHSDNKSTSTSQHNSEHPPDSPPLQIATEHLHSNTDNFGLELTAETADTAALDQTASIQLPTETVVVKANLAPKRRARRKRSAQDIHVSETPESESISPRRPTVVLPAPVHGELIVNARVIARWSSDHHYYTGRAETKLKQVNRWQVAFDDGNSAAVHTKDILVCSHFMKGQSVMAKAGEGADEYLPSIVKEIIEPDSDSHGMMYRVQFMADSTEANVSTLDICLDKAQFETLRHRILQSISTSESDNSQQSRHRTRARVVGGKKAGESSRFQLASSTPIEARTSSRLNPEPVAEEAQKKIFTELQKSPVRPLRSKKSAVPANSSSRSTISFEDTGVIPDGEALGEVFQGCVFLVTSLKQDPVAAKLLTSADIDVALEAIKEDDSIDTATESVDRKLICEMVEELGGLVIDQYDEDVMTAAQKVYLISSNMQRTVKYLQCLAGNIPPVNSLWIQNCHRDKIFHPCKNYFLPAGADITTGNILEWKRQYSLRNAIFYLASSYTGGNTFIGDWKLILRLAGASVVPKISSSTGIKPDYILVNKDKFPKGVISQARRASVPLVMPEFVIQCLISGVRHPVDLHPSFVYKP